MLKRDAELWQVGKLFEPCLYRRHIGRRRENACLNSSGGKRGENFRDAAHLENADFGVGFEAPFLERKPKYDIGGRSIGADADLLPSQIFRFIDTWGGHNRKKRLIDQSGNDDRIGAGQTCRKNRSAVNLREINVSPAEGRE